MKSPLINSKASMVGTLGTDSTQSNMFLVNSWSSVIIAQLHLIIVNIFSFRKTLLHFINTSVIKQISKKCYSLDT